MASVSIVLRKKVRKDGTYPIAIRITKDRKSSFVHTGYHVWEKDWDNRKSRVKKSHPNSGRLNAVLGKKLLEAEKVHLELDGTSKVTSAKAVQAKIKKGNKGAGFFAFAFDYVESLRVAGNYNGYTTDKPRVTRFQAFTKGEIAFEDITPTLLERFQAYLKGSHRLSDRTIANYLILIRKLYNSAIVDGVVEAKYYPFGRGKVKVVIPKSMKIGFTEDEVKTLEELSLPPESFEYHARNVWLFSFYLAGVRASDVLRLTRENIKDGRLFYTMGKNKKPGSLKLPSKAMAILDQYLNGKPRKHNLVFPDLTNVSDLEDTFDVQRKIKHAIKRLYTAMKEVAKIAGIEKKPTMHIARHTFGNLSGEKIPIQMLQKLYRHSDIQTTIVYQSNFIFKEADEALDEVINF
ncbi:MAG: tyrosine-type recombinase/integrase [Flavobacteriales bacterium]|nr:tyrosine-type recombinase/integrase [Flavobacteriales bacterium]